MHAQSVNLEMNRPLTLQTKWAKTNLLQWLSPSPGQGKWKLNTPRLLGPPWNHCGGESLKLGSPAVTSSPMETALCLTPLLGHVQERVSRAYSSSSATTHTGLLFWLVLKCTWGLIEEAGVTREPVGAWE